MTVTQPLLPVGNTMVTATYGGDSAFDDSQLAASAAQVGSCSLPNVLAMWSAFARPGQQAS